jgi:hypothetical protein
MWEMSESDDESEFEGFSETSESAEQPAQPSVTPSGKYIPPAARKAQSVQLPTHQEDPRLQKQIQGVLNR